MPDLPITPDHQGQLLPGQFLEPDAAEITAARHFAIACRTSALVLAREGHPHDAQVLHAAAADAERRVYDWASTHPEHDGWVDRVDWTPGWPHPDPAPASDAAPAREHPAGHVDTRLQEQTRQRWCEDHA